MDSPPRTLNILVIGAGAIGCLVGGKLARAGQRVTLVGRPWFVEAVEQNGLQLTIGDETHTVDGVTAAASISDAFAAAEAPFNLAVLTVKSYDTAQALDELASTLDRTGTAAPMVLSLQNGVGNEEAIVSRFGRDKVLAGTITAPVEVPAPARVRLTKSGFVVGLARWDEGDATDSPRSQTSGPPGNRVGNREAGMLPGRRLVGRLASVLEQAEVEVATFDSARSMKWSKLLMNMVGNATSAILGEPPADTFARPGVVDLEIDALREALAVMRGTGIQPINVGKYPLGTAAPLLRFAPRSLLRIVFRRIVGGARGGKMPSLYLDLEKGRRQSEVDWYNGAVVRQGARIGVATPINQCLTETLLHLVHNPDERENWRGNYQRLLTQAVRLSGG